MSVAVSKAALGIQFFTVIAAHWDGYSESLLFYLQPVYLSKSRPAPPLVR